MKTLMQKMSEAIQDIIKNHEEPIVINEVITSILSLGVVFSMSKLGNEETLSQLATQMVMVAQGDSEKILQPIEEMLNSIYHIGLEPVKPFSSKDSKKFN